MSYTLLRYGAGHGERLAQFVLPIATRTYANWVDPAMAQAWADSEHGSVAWNLRLEDPSTHVLVAERPDTSIAACAFVSIRKDTAHLGGLYVEDVKRGLAGRLRDERLRIGEASGARVASMFIRETNECARTLAERAGFTRVGEFPCNRLPTVPLFVDAMALSPKPTDDPITCHQGISTG